jgi:hypothetical protein
MDGLVDLAGGSICFRDIRVQNSRAGVWTKDEGFAAPGNSFLRLDVFRVCHAPIHE